MPDGLGSRLSVGGFDGQKTAYQLNPFEYSPPLGGEWLRKTFTGHMAGDMLRSSERPHEFTELISFRPYKRVRV